MKKRALFFMHLVQDLDLVFPLLKEMKARADCDPLVYVTDRLINASPRVKKALRSLPVGCKTVSYIWALFGFGPPVRGFDVLLTAAESNARPHWVAHRLTERANREGLTTYTLQHGFEQPGLTYFDETYTPENFSFASQKIMIWGNADSLDRKVPDSIRGKCVPVGWPKTVCVPNDPPNQMFNGRVVLVSENLHRTCYKDEFRSRFIENVQNAAKKYRDVTFIVKPHHNQRWLGVHHERRFTGFQNVVLADSFDPRWEPYTANVLAGVSDAVITTPSTVALDAAMTGCPVAVVDDGRPDLGRYEPLVRLKSGSEWIKFIEDALDTNKRSEEARKARVFVQRTVIEGDACKRIVDLIAG